MFISYINGDCAFLFFIIFSGYDFSFAESLSFDYTAVAGLENTEEIALPKLFNIEDYGAADFFIPRELELDISIYFIPLSLLAGAIAQRIRIYGAPLLLYIIWIP